MALVDTTVPLLQQLDPTYGLAERLRQLVRQQGMEPMVRRTGISRAQLARYMNGTPIPSDRLAILVQEFGLAPGRFLLGQQEPPAPNVPESRDDRLGLIVKTLFETLQVHYRGPVWRPSELAHLIPLLEMNDRFVTAQGHTWLCTTEEMLCTLTYLEPFRKGELLAFYKETLSLMLKHQDLTCETTWAVPFCTMVKEACSRFYDDTLDAQSYFTRVNIHLKGHNRLIVEDFITHYQKFCGPLAQAKVLDVGCGTGRYLSYLYRHYEGVQVHGLESSRTALEMVKSYEQENLLPEGCVQAGDAFAIPHPKGTFQAVLCHMLLHYHPLVEGDTLAGVGRILSEIHRVLQKGGIAHFLFRQEEANEFLPMFNFCHPLPKLEALAKQLGFQLVGAVPLRAGAAPFPGNTVPPRYGTALMMTLRKA